jgi:hypothetical protein
MKFLAMLLFCVSIAACKTPNADPTPEIHKSVVEYFQTPRVVQANSTDPEKVEVLGVSPRMLRDNFYIVDVQVRRQEGQTIDTVVICRKFSNNLSEYWKTEPYDYLKVKMLQIELPTPTPQ